MHYSEYPRSVVEDIARLRRAIARSRLPAKRLDENLIIGTWNLRMFGDIYPQYNENPGSPKRNLRAIASIVEVIRHYDVIAIQEVKRDLEGLNTVLEWLGPDWGALFSDVTAGDQGNTERLAFIFDRRRVQPSGLAGELVLPPTPQGDPVVQFARTPYIVGFNSAGQHFVLLTAHIKYGNLPADRLPEIRALATYIAEEIQKRSLPDQSEERNLIVLGDFNIDKRGDNPLFQAFILTGLVVPEQLENLSSSYGAQPKYYDQIAWFMGGLALAFIDAGVVNFSGAVYPEISLQSMSFRISDHLPLWAEFSIDRSAEQMAPTLGLDPAHPDPLGTVPG
jgi:endonuclease/exonuclease/phosphatase family metal-dependent hydrolase